MEKLFEMIYGFTFSLLGITVNSNNITGTISNLLNFNYLRSNFTLWGAVSGVNNALVPLGTSILTLFFMINLIKTLTGEGVERITWERITLKACVFFLLNHFIQHSFGYMQEIGNIVHNSIYSPVVQNGTLSGVSTGSMASLPQSLAAICEAQGGIQKYLYAGLFIILAIPFMATIIMILAQVFLRAIKLMIYIMVSPIPIAMAAEGETFRGKAIGFFMNFAGVCFEAVVIYIGLWAYAKGLNDIGTDVNTSGVSIIIAIMFMNGLFSAVIGLAGQLSKEFFGRG